MFYPDLTPYSYLDHGRDTFTDMTTGYRFVSFKAPYTRINIGWLDANKPWTAGPVPAAFAEKLQAILAIQAVNECLGYHDCDLCPELPRPDEQTWRRLGHIRACSGNGEIRLPAQQGAAYAAPRLVGHYVLDHGYQPPEDFIDAVLAFDLDGHSEPSWARFPWIPPDAEVLDE
ncbi:hypothetical protein LN042_35625 [Kitasatospora sp. RB6PN24]|uniref:DUF7919 family protein n=1 Tax=Kitasatospora humi TaxID=2893891 RepID=UPI001E35F321|nr:hypothetical protein [Kitasatospora humi]MCC9312328.1 hypothetical protein [Kitasatospora humi]